MPGDTRVLRIGTVVTAARFTAVLTDRFTARHPHVPVHVVTLPAAEIVRDGAQVILATPQGRVRADHVVLATNAFAGEWDTD